MNTNKWLYFREVTDTDDDDGSLGAVADSTSTSVMIPAKNVMHMQPFSDTGLSISFKSVKQIDSGGGNLGTGRPYRDTVTLTVKANTHETVMEAITEAITAPNRDSFIDVCDLVTTLVDESTRQATKINSNITGIGAINLYKTPQGFGMHEYFEIVAGFAASHDDDVVASMRISLPNEVILLEAAMYPITLASSNHGLLALEYHTASVATDDASAGIEILGADTLNLTQVEDAVDYAGTGNTADNTSIPHANLDVSSDATAGKGIHTGVMDPIATGANPTFFQICAKEDMSAMTGVPYVGVYIKWWGGPAVPTY